MPRALLILAVLLSLGWGGPAFAQAHFRDAIRSTVQGMTLDEIIQWSNAQFRKQAAIGRYVRWGGAIVLGSALVYTALDWFYNSLKAQSGTSLDQWYYWNAVSDWLYYVRERDCDIYFGKYVWFLSYRNANREWDWMSPDSCTAPDPAKAQAEALARWGSRSGYTWYGPVKVDGRNVWYYVPAQSRPSLSDWLQSHPDAANGVKQAVTRYLDSNPISSPTAPYPGVQLEPVPNPNQWTDNPFTRPDIDTDGDGWPDPVEWREANRRYAPWPDYINDPARHPDPNEDADGDGYSNLEEVQLGTDPYDPASRPSTRTPTSPWTDTDGDGYSDAEEISKGTNPNDPASHPDTPPEQKPEEPQWPGGPAPLNPQPVQLPGVPQLEKKALPRFSELDQIANAWREQVLDTLQQRIRRLRDLLATKFPFGIVSRLATASVGSDAASCSVSVNIGPHSAEWNPCNTPFWQAAATFRPVITGLFFLTLAFTLVRRALDVQQ